MPKKLFKRLTIDAHHLRQHSVLSRMGDRLHDPNLWHLNRHSVARGFFAGMFAGFAFLIFPGQLLISAIIAIAIRGNLPIAAALVFITNPLTSPPILYVALTIGQWIIPSNHSVNLDHLLDFEWTFNTLGSQLRYFISFLLEIWQPLLAGCFVLGMSLAVLSYFAVDFFWRWHVSRAWAVRRKRRQESTQH